MNDYKNLKTKLQLGKKRDLNFVQEKDVNNIEDVKIDTNLSKKDRMLNFLQVVKNPYIFRVDGIKVKFEFSEKGKDISKCFENLIFNRVK